MTEKEIEEYLKQLKRKLLAKSNWRRILLNRTWTKLAPEKPGVYVFIECGKIVYVGETGNLRERMNDLLDSRHHTMRRTIGRKFYSQRKGFTMATSKLKFPPAIEKLVTKHLCEKYYCAYLPIDLGRKELEEMLCDEMEAQSRLNIRVKRKVR